MTDKVIAKIAIKTLKSQIRRRLRAAGKYSGMEADRDCLNVLTPVQQNLVRHSGWSIAELKTAIK